MGFQSNFAKQAAADQGQAVLNFKEDQDGRPSQAPASTSTQKLPLATPSKAEARVEAPQASVVTPEQKPDVQVDTKEVKIDEPFNTAKLFKLIDAVGQHINMSQQEISAVKRKSLAPQEGKKLYVEYSRLLQEIQHKTYAQNQASNKAGNTDSQSTVQPTVQNQNSQSNSQGNSQPSDQINNGFYEFKYVNNGKTQTMKKSKAQYPEFEYYDGCTVEYVPASTTIFAEQKFSKKLKP